MPPTSRRKSMLALLVCLLAPLGARAADAGGRPTPPPRNFPAEISRDRAAWTASSARIYELLIRIHQVAGTVLDLNGQIDRQNRAIADLNFKMNQALDDMRHGEFCTGCGKTRRQIEAEGDRFPHPGQSVRPARPEELEKCRQDYGAKIAAARSRLAQLEQQKKDASQRAGDAYFEFQNVQPVYHQQLFDEKNARLAEWGADFARFEAEVRDLRSRLVAARTLRDHAGTPEERTARQAGVDSLERLLATESESARAATARAAQDERAFFTAANADLDRLGAAASEIHAIFGIPDGWYIDKLIRSSPPLAYTVSRVPGVDYDARAAGPADSARDLLEGRRAAAADTPAPALKPSASASSARELLEGR